MKKNKKLTKSEILHQNYRNKPKPHSSSDWDYLDWKIEDKSTNIMPYELLKPIKNISKKYKLPSGYNEEMLMQESLKSGKEWNNKIAKRIVRLNPQLQPIYKKSKFKTDIVAGIASRFPVEDIKYFVDLESMDEERENNPIAKKYILPYIEKLKYEDIEFLEHYFYNEENYKNFFLKNELEELKNNFDNLKSTPVKFKQLIVKAVERYMGDYIMGLTSPYTLFERILPHLKSKNK